MTARRLTVATQKERVLRLLQAGHELTPMDGYVEVGTMRLAAIIYDLKKDGFEIQTDMVEVPTRYGTTTKVARYSLAATWSLDGGVTKVRRG